MVYPAGYCVPRRALRRNAAPARSRRVLAYFSAAAHGAAKLRHVFQLYGGFYYAQWRY